MQVEEKRIIIDSNWFSAERDVHRTKGLHLSHVIDFIEEQESGKKRDRPDGGGLSDIGHNYAAGGFLWERVLTRLIEHNPKELWEWLFTQVMNEIDDPDVIRPGEQVYSWECPDCSIETRDECRTCEGTGILSMYMTPDGVNILGDGTDIYLEEYKFTTKSSKDPITHPKFGRWVRYQIPCYLKVMNLTKCRLRVYFVRGDYTTGEPAWYEYIITFSQTEIDEIWESVVLNAQYMYRHGLAMSNKS